MNEFWRRMLVQCVGSALLLSAVFHQTMAASDPGATEYVEKTVRFGFTVRNPQDRPATGERLQVYVPASTENQTLLKLDASYPYQLSTDEYGNNLASINLPDMTQHATIRVTVTATAKLATVPPRVPLRGMKAYLSAEPFVEVDHPRIQELSRQFMSAAGEAGYVDHVYNWVRKRIRYAGFVADDLGALSALLAGSGDCSEYAYLVAAFNRAGEIPTKVLGGYYVGSNAVLKAADYHNWNEVYLDERWQLMDAQKGVVKGSSSNFVVTRVVVRGDESGRFIHRYFSAGGGVHVEMD